MHWEQSRHSVQSRFVKVLIGRATPATMTSAVPSRTRRKASPMACVPAAHAVAGARLGPRRPWRMLTAPAAMFPSTLGTNMGPSLCTGHVATDLVALRALELRLAHMHGAVDQRVHHALCALLHELVHGICQASWKHGEHQGSF